MVAAVQVGAAKIAGSLGRSEEEGTATDDNDTTFHETICLHIQNSYYNYQ